MKGLFSVLVLAVIAILPDKSSTHTLEIRGNERKRVAESPPDIPNLTSNARSVDPNSQPPQLIPLPPFPTKARKHQRGYDLPPTQRLLPPLSPPTFSDQLPILPMFAAIPISNRLNKPAPSSFLERWLGKWSSDTISPSSAPMIRQNAQQEHPTILSPKPIRPPGFASDGGGALPEWLS